MRTTRIFIDQPVRVGSDVTLPDTASAHLLRVLRLREGDACVLFNGDGRDYDARLVSRASAAPAVVARVVGKHCESGDIVIKDCWLPEDLGPGDLIAVAATGAYCYSMSSRYNLLCRPAVVAVHDGEARLILRRETVDDLLSLEVTDS